MPSDSITITGALLVGLATLATVVRLLWDRGDKKDAKLDKSFESRVALLERQNTLCEERYTRLEERIEQHHRECQEAIADISKSRDDAWRQLAAARTEHGETITETIVLRELARAKERGGSSGSGGDVR